MDSLPSPARTAPKAWPLDWLPGVLLALLSPRTVFGRSVSWACRLYYAREVIALREPAFVVPLTDAENPRTAWSSAYGVHQIWPNWVVIRIRPSGPQYAWEAVLAHELGHTRLMRKGFPRIGMPVDTGEMAVLAEPGVPARQQARRDITNPLGPISNSLEDVLIDNRLAEQTTPLTPAFLNFSDRCMGQILRQLGNATLAGSIGDPLALPTMCSRYLYYTYIRFLRDKAETVQRGLLQKVPHLADFAPHLLAICDRYDWSTPDGMQKTLEALKDFWKPWHPDAEKTEIIEVDRKQIVFAEDILPPAPV